MSIRILRVSRVRIRYFFYGAGFFLPPLKALSGGEIMLEIVIKFLNILFFNKILYC
jgi:hypothetical protein